MSEPITTKRKYVRIDQSTWGEIEGIWEAGDATLQELEQRYGVSRRALQSHFAKRGSVKGSQAAQLAAAVKQQVFSENLADPDLITSRAVETRETAYRNAVVVEGLIMAQLDAAQKDPSQALRAAGAIKALSLAAAGLERIHNLKWRALGLDKDSVQGDQLTVLVFEDLTAAEIATIQEHDTDDNFGDAAAFTSSGGEDEVVVIGDEQFQDDHKKCAEDATIKQTGGRLVKSAQA